MRFIVGLIAIAALVAIVAISTGWLKIGQTQSASLPTLKVEGGQLPAYNAQVAKVEVGTENRTVEVPTVRVDKPGQ